MPNYTYIDLAHDESMRILTVLPNRERSNPIHCHLEHRPKSTECHYDALSYAWEGEKPTASIQIISQNTLYNLPVIPNLEAALRQLRHPERNFILWVDAVCINQASNLEKSHQVPQMSRIYSEADNVRVWLGVEEPGKSELALKFINRILDFENFDRLIADVRLVKEWAALLSLMKRTWFGRRWVVQEVALAKRAFLHCGKDWVSWDDFADAVRLFEERTETIEEHFMKAPDFGFRSDLVQDIKAMSATRLVHATSNLFRKSNDGQILEWMRDFETLVSELSPFEASNPRDIIYGVLALAKDTKSTAQKRVLGEEIAIPPSAMGNGYQQPPPAGFDTRPSGTPPPSAQKRKGRGAASSAKRRKSNGTDSNVDAGAGPSTRPKRGASAATGTSDPLETKHRVFTEKDKSLVRFVINKLKTRIAAKHFHVNYDKSFFQVCKDFLMFVTRKSQKLDILCRPWAPQNIPNETLPSWIPTLSSDGYGKRGDGSFMRINADPLVGGSDKGHQNYNASKSYPATCQFGDWIRGQDPKSLRVKGFILDTIGKTTRHPAMSGDIPADWPSFAGWSDASTKPPKPFWMTLVAGRGPDGLNPPDFYQRACQYAFTKKVPGGPLDVRYLLTDPAVNSIAKGFLKRMQSVVWMRRLMLTRDKSILGLVPDRAMPGDLVCIVFGCSVPVVLREQEHGQGVNRGTHFEFLGECYVDGMMDGQALDIGAADQGRAGNYRMFELR